MPTQRDNKELRKTTRWDRIRKRYAGNETASSKSSTIRKLIEMDFVGEHNKNILIDEKTAKTTLDPRIVMDLRHEMCRKIPKKLPLATVAHPRNLDTCIAHNIAVEERYIDNELNKFRQQLEKNHKRNQLKLNNELNKEIDNKCLMESLEKTAKHVEDFYEAPIDALMEMEEIFEIRNPRNTQQQDEIDEDVPCNDNMLQELNCEMTSEVSLEKYELGENYREKSSSVTRPGCSVKEQLLNAENNKFSMYQLKNVELGENYKEKSLSVTRPGCSVKEQLLNAENNTFSMDQLKNVETAVENICRTPSPLQSTEEALKPYHLAAQCHLVHLHCVRFENDEVEKKLIRLNSTSSDTSDGIDSVISDIAEEALFELQMEEEAQVKEKINAETEVIIENHSQIEELVEIIDKNPNELEQNQMTFEDKNRNEVEQNRMTANKNELEQNQMTFEDKNPNELKHNQMTFEDKNPNELKDKLKYNQMTIPKPLIIKRLGPPPQVQVEQKESNNLVASTEEEDESITNREQNEIIQKLFQPRAENKIKLLQKYIKKWMHYTTISRIERESITSCKKDRLNKINSFLDKIRIERKQRKKYKENDNEADADEMNLTENSENMEMKCKVTQKVPVGAANITKKYRNKIKIQQDIIELQRLKLERQERLIVELKLNKYSDDAKEARQAIKNELKTVIRTGEPKSKTKAKCLQIIGNLRNAKEKENNHVRLQGHAMPQFLDNMRERALERSVKHEQARQRRLQKEAEREAQKLAAEEAKRLEDEEAKRQRILALKEKRRQEKLCKILKERERLRLIENNRKADEFNRRLLLRRIGIEGFKRLIQLKRDNERKCEHFRRENFKRTYFNIWHRNCQTLKEQRLEKAIKFHNKIILKQCMAKWLIYVKDERSKYTVAGDWYDMRLSELALKQWYGLTVHAKMIEETKMRQAKSHYEWHLKWRILDCWQRLPQILKLEKETEERRQRWRMKIWELLPDYTPQRDDDQEPL